MKILLFVLFAFVCCTGLSAQKKAFVTVKAGSNIMDVLSAADVFYYPQFTSGKVFLRDGTTAAATLNYSRLVDEMHFVGHTGDTLALADEKNVKYLVIGTDTFYYDEGYVRLLSGGRRVKAGIRQVWRISDARKVGAFNTTNNSVAITSYTSYNEGGRLYDLTVQEDVILSHVEQYLLGDEYNHFVAVSKKNILALFPSEQKRIESYLKENKINFDKKEDVVKTVQFLEQL